MPATLVASNTYAQLGSAAGVSIDLGSAPAAGEFDVLLIVSNGVIQVQPDFSTEVLLNNAASTLAWRQAVGNPAEQNVTVTTPQGAVNLLIRHTRWANVDSMEVVDSALAESAGTTSPALSTGALAESDELVILALGMIGFNPAPTTAVFSAGYTDPFVGNNTTFGTLGSDAVGGWMGYNAAAGPAAESPTVGWTNGSSNRYGFIIAFQTSADVPTNVNLTPAVVNFSAVPLAATPYATIELTPAVVSFSAVPLLTPITIELTPAVVNFSAVPLGAAPPPIPPTTSVNLTLMNFGPIVTGIAACVCAALDELGIGVCTCIGMTVGPPVWDACDCTCTSGGGRGQLAAYISGPIIPSTSFPQLAPLGQLDRGCGPPYLVAPISIEIARCWPTDDPTPAELTAAAMAHATDMTAVRQAVGCCLQAMESARTISRFAMASTSVIGPQGGCAGSSLEVLVALPHCICP